MKVSKTGASAGSALLIAVAAVVSCAPVSRPAAEGPGAADKNPSSAAVLPARAAPDGGPLVIKKAADPTNVCFVPSDDVRARIGDEAYAVVAQGATEPPFRNAYWDNHQEGVYVDAVDGTPLFTSREKYESGTGWPSFWSPIRQDSLELVEDLSFGMRRVEVLSKSSGAHLGHLFDDGPQPTGKRYCMNSASMRFIPRDELVREGYPDLVKLFD